MLYFESPEGDDVDPAVINGVDDVEVDGPKEDILVEIEDEKEDIIVEDDDDEVVEDDEIVDDPEVEG